MSGRAWGKAGALKWPWLPLGARRRAGAAPRPAGVPAGLLAARPHHASRSPLRPCPLLLPISPARPRPAPATRSRATVTSWRPPAACCPPPQTATSAWRLKSVSPRVGAARPSWGEHGLCTSAAGQLALRRPCVLRAYPTCAPPPGHCLCSRGAVPRGHGALRGAGPAQARRAAAARRRGQAVPVHRPPVADPCRPVPAVRPCGGGGSWCVGRGGGQEGTGSRCCPAVAWQAQHRCRCSSSRAASPRPHAPAFPLCSCLLSKCYSGAGAALDADVFTVDPRLTATTPTDVLLYCYYGALLEIGRWALGGRVWPAGQAGAPVQRCRRPPPEGPPGPPAHQSVPALPCTGGATPALWSCWWRL